MHPTLPNGLDSTAMNSTYDYAVSRLGPSASNSLVEGHKPTLKVLRRLVSAVMNPDEGCREGQASLEYGVWSMVDKG